MQLLKNFRLLNSKPLELLFLIVFDSDPSFYHMSIETAEKDKNKEDSEEEEES